MTVLASSHYRNTCRISKDRFTAILRERANPELLDERDPSEYYAVCRERNCDPLYILSMFGKESTYGNYGVARTSKSWGNTRAPNFGVFPVGEMPGRTGTFPVWKDWKDGLISTVARLMAENYYYAGEKRTIGEVNKDPHYPHRNTSKPAFPPIPRIYPIEWAPAGDLNDPDSYLGWVLTFMNTHQDMEDTVIHAEIPGFLWRPASKTHFQRGRNEKIRGGAQHYTGGTNSLDWLTHTSNPPVSSTILIKRKPTLNDRGWQLVKLADTAWTTAFANEYTVSIELEHPGGPVDDDQYLVMAQTWIDLAAEVKKQNLGEIPLNRQGIRGHKEWIGDPTYTCPDGIDLDKLVQEIARLQKKEPDDPNARLFEETNQWIVNVNTDDGPVPMLDGWRQAGGIGVCGFPLAGMTRDEVNSVPVYVQLCENVLCEYWPKGWDGKSAAVFRFGDIGRRYRDLLRDYNVLRTDG